MPSTTNKDARLSVLIPRWHERIWFGEILNPVATFPVGHRPNIDVNHVIPHGTCQLLQKSLRGEINIAVDRERSRVRGAILRDGRLSPRVLRGCHIKR
jgi:hypothetical protein